MERPTKFDQADVEAIHSVAMDYIEGCFKGRLGRFEDRRKELACQIHYVLRIWNEGSTWLLTMQEKVTRPSLAPRRFAVSLHRNNARFRLAK